MTFGNSLTARGVYRDMAYRAIAHRFLRMTALLVLGLCILLIALAQFQQRLLRYRVERLLADIHSVRLHQSTWNDAQILMKRWGAWGHYEGNCSANDCRYGIVLEDFGSRLLRTNAHRLNYDLLRHLSAFRIYQLVGGRFASMVVEFIVQDGTIWRTSAALVIQVPPQSSPKFGFGEYSLIVRTHSRQALADGPGILGSDGQLAQHPDYKIGRPGGCTACLMATVIYTPHLAQSEIQRLTAFNLSCLTRLHACTTLEEVLPAVRGLHLYPITEPDDHPVDPPRLPPRPCDIPIWALGRDATFVLVVDALSTRKEQAYGQEHEKAEVKVIALRSKSRRLGQSARYSR